MVAIRYDAAIGRHIIALEGEFNRAPCGCVSRVFAGKWQLIAVCDGGRRMGVRPKAKRD